MPDIGRTAMDQQLRTAQSVALEHLMAVVTDDKAEMDARLIAATEILHFLKVSE